LNSSRCSAGSGFGASGGASTFATGVTPVASDRTVMALTMAPAEAPDSARMRAAWFGTDAGSRRLASFQASSASSRKSMTPAV
jgi:hypothetical protein